MNDQGKTKQQLLEALTDLRRQVAEQEAQIAQHQQIEADLQHINDNVSILVATAGFDGYYKKVNAAFKKMLGWSEQEIFSRPFIEFVHPDDRASGLKALGQVESGKTLTNFVDRTLCKDGSYRWISWAVIPFPNRGVVYGIGSDITEQKQAEKSLRESEERYRQLADSTPDVIYILDKAGKLIYANRVAGAYFGVSPESLVGKTQHDLFPPEKAAHHLERIRNSFETGDIGDTEALYRFGDHEVWLNVRTIPLRDTNGQVTSLMGICRDVTQRKQAEEELKKAHDELEERVEERTAELTTANKALQESEENFRTLVDMSPDAVLTGDLTGHVTFASRQAIQMYRAENFEEMLGKNPLEFFAPEDHLKFLTNVQKTLEEGITRDIPYNLVRKDGTHFVGEVSAATINDTTGKPKGFVAILRDITERKQAEEALRQSHDELRAIHDGMSDGFLIADAETKQFVQANASICRMLGYSEEELLSKSVMDIHPDKDLPAIMEIFQSQVEGHFRVAMDLPVKRKDGSTFIADIGSDSALHNGRPCLIGFFHDVTERKQAEEALRQSHDELRAIHDGMVEGLLVTDIETLRFLRANASICRMLGYSEAELLSLSLEDIHPAEALPFILEKIRSADKADHTRPGNIPFLRKDGSVFHVEAIGKSLIYDGKPCSMGIFRDITERLQAEAALEQERQSLWKMLQASDHERQTISYDIHDGLAQYLAAAGMGFQTYDSMRENDPDEARKAYETAVELVRQAHGESRRLIGEVRHPVIDERGLSTAIVSLAYEQQQRGGPKIECHTRVEFNRLPPILENALYRMAQEALTNARKHSKSKKVTVTMVQEGQDVRLEIQDWGVGFDPNAIEKGHFGLESIRQRVRLLGGQLTIESKPNSGTLIQIVVPILEKHTEN